MIVRLKRQQHLHIPALEAAVKRFSLIFKALYPTILSQIDAPTKKLFSCHATKKKERSSILHIPVTKGLNFPAKQAFYF
jgi:hypothetical protein